MAGSSLPILSLTLTRISNSLILGIDENNHTQIKPHNEAVTQQGCTLEDRGGPDCEFNNSTAVGN